MFFYRRQWARMEVRTPTHCSVFFSLFHNGGRSIYILRLCNVVLSFLLATTPTPTHPPALLSYKQPCSS